MIGCAFLLFIVGLAGKSSAVNKKSMKKSEFFQRLTVFSLILMLLCAVVYAFIT
jgi:hypothetical protein